MNGAASAVRNRFDWPVLLWLATWAVVPALALLRATLGEWRVPLEWPLLVALLASLKRGWQRALLLAGYWAVLATFVLRAFNVELMSLGFYADFAGSLPPPRPATVLAMLSMALALPAVSLAQRVFDPGRRARCDTAKAPLQSSRWAWLAASLLVACLLAARQLGGVESSVRRTLPSPAGTLLRDQFGPLLAGPPEAATQPGSAAPRQAAAAALLSAADWLGANGPLPDQLVLVVVESWADTAAGLQALEGLARSAFGSRLQQVTSGWRPWQGATLNGELRELCGLQLPLTHAADIPVADCLPRRLAARGYTSIAGHGYQGLFYLRSVLYPRLGFSNSTFLEQARAALPVCPGAFTGLCDGALFGLLMDQAGPSPRRLVYFMSLQSHEPVLAMPHAGAAPQVADEAGLPLSTREARGFVATVLRDLAARPALGCRTVVHLVGDHPPPSLAASGQDAPGVSYLHLRLQDQARCPSSGLAPGP